MDILRVQKACKCKVKKSFTQEHFNNFWKILNNYLLILLTFSGSIIVIQIFNIAHDNRQPWMPQKFFWHNSSSTNGLWYASDLSCLTKLHCVGFLRSFRLIVDIMFFNGRKNYREKVKYLQFCASFIEFGKMKYGQVW